MSKWILKDTIVYYIPQNIKTKSKVKLAGFDMDGTLIFSSKGDKYAKSVDDFILAFDNIPKTLKEYSDAGYLIVIISNRKVAPNGKNMSDVKNRMKLIFKQIGFECCVFLLTGKDEYRKPGIRVLEFIKELLDIETFAKGSFYCGDAAEEYTTSDEDIEDEFPYKNWTHWSNSDYGLVQNWNKNNPDKLKFYLPNKIFDEFPSWELHAIENNIKLVILCGQVNSGIPTKEIKYSISDSTIFHLKKYSSFKNDYSLCEYKDKTKNNITVILGNNLTNDDRDYIEKKFNVKKSETLIVWFARPSFKELTRTQLLNYSKSFEIPEKNFIRAN